MLGGGGRGSRGAIHGSDCAKGRRGSGALICLVVVRRGVGEGE